MTGKKQQKEQEDLRTARTIVIRTLILAAIVATRRFGSARRLGRYLEEAAVAGRGREAWTRRGL